MSNSEKKEYKLGIIGLGTMGRNLMYNMADHGFAVSGFDTNVKKVEQLDKEGKKFQVKGFKKLNAFIDSLESPKIVLLLVPAGKIVDNVIAELLPLLQQGAIIIDAGNSHFTDTDRRTKQLKEKGFQFLGMGVSGGAKGARNGPSMMPGGEQETYKIVQPVFEAIAAKVNNEPCVCYIGPGSSGHFVKMVHNGIEYAIMELIAETYQVFKKVLQLKDEAIQQIFTEWSKGRLASYLLEITGIIFSVNAKGKDNLLLDDIKDQAKALGTGKWTSQAAMDLALPTTIIDTAVAIRNLSKYKTLRVELDKIYSIQNSELNTEDASSFVAKMEQAFYFSIIMAYAQGMHLLSKASETYSYHLNLADIAKIWRGGCIIRSRFLDVIFDAFQKKNNLTHLLLDEKVQSIIKETIQDTRFVLSAIINKRIGSPAYAAALTYFDMLSSSHVPANLIQAQRDFFGAHTYELIGKEGTFHADWEKEQ